MNRRARRPVDIADALRRSHAALGEAIAGLRNVSLRGDEQGANWHRIRLAEAQVFEARYHLGAAGSLLAVGLGLRDPARVPAAVLTVAQVVAARRAIRRLARVREAVAGELRAVAVRLGDPELARVHDALPPERMPRPVAEAFLYGGVGFVLCGVAALLAGGVLAGLAAVSVGALGIGAASHQLAAPR